MTKIADNSSGPGSINFFGFRIEIKIFQNSVKLNFQNFIFQFSFESSIEKNIFHIETIVQSPLVEIFPQGVISSFPWGGFGTFIF